MAEEKFRPSLSYSEVVSICESNLKEVDPLTWLKFEAFRIKIAGGTIQGTMVQGASRIPSSHTIVNTAPITIPSTLPQAYHNSYKKYKVIGPQALTWMEYYNLSVYYTLAVDNNTPVEFKHSDEFTQLLFDIAFMQKRGDEMYSLAVVAAIPTHTYTEIKNTPEETAMLAQVARQVDEDNCTESELELESKSASPTSGEWNL